MLKLIEMDEKHNFISQEKPFETSSNLLPNSLDLNVQQKITRKHK